MGKDASSVIRTLPFHAFTRPYGCRGTDAVLEEVFAFCRTSQAEFDAAEDREALEDAAWVPSEMKEVVKVAFGCPP